MFGAAALAVSACGGSDTRSSQIDASDWDAVLAEAHGQTVSWYLPGDDDALASFVDDEVAPRLAELGVTLDLTPAAETGAASADAVWVDGETFASGASADLWTCGWADDLPNAQFVDLEDPVVSTDLGVSVDDCASVWQRTSSALVYDSADLTSSDVASVGSLLSWSRAHPGRFTYPAPPDPTGSMAVRSILYAQIDGPDKLPRAFDEAAFENGTAPLWKLLDRVEPTLWRGGPTYPSSQAEVERLYADGEVSAYFTDRPGDVSQLVADGTFPDSTRQSVPASGNISSTSHLAIPADADHPAAALVLANLLQDPRMQLALLETTGALPGIDVTRAPADVRQAFGEIDPGAAALSIAALSTNAVPELDGEYVARIDDGWRTEVLRH